MNWLDYAKESVTDPRSAAPRLQGFDLPNGALWTWLALLAVLNGMLYWLILPPELLPPTLGAPVPLAIFIAVVMLATVFIMTATGRIFGGEGDLDALLRVTVWLQTLRLAAQVLITAVGILIPALAAIVGFAVGVWGIYMLTCFVASAHRFGGLLRALAVIAVGFVAAILILSLLMGMLGVTPGEMNDF